MVKSLTTATFSLAMASLVAGCAGEWSPDSHAPADFKTTYVKITDKCEISKSHGDKYVETWISPNAHDAWKAGQPLPHGDTDGAVLIKVGFADSACADPVEHWTMKKTANTGDIKDWNWQTLDEYGDINQKDQSQMSGCTGCHSGYKDRDFVGTPAPATGT